MNSINTDFPFALDGRDGGSYTPSGDLIINGLTISTAGGLSGAVSVAGGLTVFGAQSVIGGMLVGGLLLAAADLQVDGNFTKALDCTDTAISQFAGAIRVPQRIARGNVTTGTHTFNALANQHVFNDAATAAGVSWQVLNTPAAANGEWFRFVQTDNANAIDIKNPAGTVLISLVYTAGNPYAVTVAFVGGTLTIIDVSLHP